MWSAHWFITPGAYSELRSWGNENGVIVVADDSGGGGGGDQGGDDDDDDADDDDVDDDSGGGGAVGGGDEDCKSGVADASSEVLHWLSGLVASGSK